MEVRAREFGEGLDVGGVSIPNRVVLAPMTGITDAPFRRLVAELGAGWSSPR